MIVDDDIRTIKTRIQKKIEALEFKIAVQKELLSEVETLRPVAKRPATTKAPQTVPGSMASRIAKVLGESEKPLKVAEIAERIAKDSNLEDTPKNLKAHIATGLTRRKDMFERVDRGLYSLKANKEALTEVT